MLRLCTLTSLEVRRRLRDPLALVTWIAIPFVLIALMSVVFGRGSNPLPPVPVLVVDQDGGLVSRLLVTALQAPQAGEHFQVRSVSMEEAGRLMDHGKASLLFVIPEGFSTAYLDGDPIRLEVFRNPQESILPKIGEELVRFLARAGEGLRAAVLPLLPADRFKDGKTQLTWSQIQEVSESFHTIFQDPKARNLLSGAGLPIEEHHPPGSQRSKSEIIGWFAPGFVAMAFLFLASGQSQEIQEDLLSGRLRRDFSLPSSPALPVFARLAALTVSTTLSGLVLAGLLVLVLGWRPGPVAPLVLHLVASAGAMCGLALFLRSMSRNPEAGGAATSGVMVGLGFLGGCFVPAIFLPGFLRGIASWIPPGWIVQGLLVLQGSHWGGLSGGVATRTLALAASGIVLTALATLNLRRAVERP